MIRLLRAAELGQDGVVAALVRPHAETAPEVVERVAAIVDEVRRRGDAALIELTREDFVKRSSVIRYTPAGLRTAWPHLAVLAAAEGLMGHHEAARVRIEEEA